jgi:hypothetical protein
MNLQPMTPVFNRYDARAAHFRVLKLFIVINVPVRADASATSGQALAPPEPLSARPAALVGILPIDFISTS